ncbi:MAG: sigma 54-interacting transcriptional regulator [Pseudomonadota bacterium]
MTQKTILLAEDDANIRLVVNQTLIGDGYTVRATSSPEALERWVRNGEGDLIVTDVYLTDTPIFDLLPSFRLVRPELPVIVMSGQNTVLTAASAAEHGAFDYLPKPFDLDHLSDTVARALKTEPAVPTGLKVAHTEQADQTLPLIGRSEPMQSVYRIISRVMNTDLTILIEGESGTGKEVTARAIHDLSSDWVGSFHSIDLATMGSDEISRVLFGDGTKSGLAHEHDSTLYLDEIGDLPPEAQTQLVKLLKEDRGARIIASTRKPLSTLVEAGDFREDLYYKINVVRIDIPPLRYRKEDISELINAFLLRAEKRGLARKQLESGAMDLLLAYNWPGNVRELENLVFRLAALTTDSVIAKRDVERELRAESVKDLVERLTFEQEVEALLNRHAMADLLQNADEGERIHQKVIEQVERPLIKLALTITAGNKLKTAALLGLNRNTLRARMRSLGLADN